MNRILLTVVLIAGSQVAEAQQRTLPSPLREGLKIYALVGDRAINSSDQNISYPPIIEVRDQNERPVERAQVVFLLPESGPGGSFPGKKTTFITTTNSQGQAAATGFQANSQFGDFTIRVRATFGNLSGEMLIQQTNRQRIAVGPFVQKPWWKRKRVWLVAGAAAGGLTASLLLRRREKSLILTPGPVGIGGR